MCRHETLSAVRQYNLVGQRKGIVALFGILAVSSDFEGLRCGSWDVTNLVEFSSLVILVQFPNRNSPCSSFSEL